MEYEHAEECVGCYAREFVPLAAAGEKSGGGVATGDL
jgi:hypothetical protein